MSIEALVETLLEQVKAQEGWPEPHLLAEILAQGPAAVEPLRKVLRQDYPEWPEVESYSYAAGCLGSIGDAAAIPDLLSLFRRVDNEVLETAAQVLGEFGPAIIEPALEIARDNALPWYPRSLLCDAAIVAADDDAVARARIAEALRGILADCVRLGEEARAEAMLRADGEDDVIDDEEDDDAEEADEPETAEFVEDEEEEEEHYHTIEIEDDVDDFVEMASLVVLKLAELADPLARGVIETAFRGDIIDETLVSRADVEEAYKDGGRLPESGREPFLSRYERAYAEHQESQRRLADEREARRLSRPLIEPWKEPAPRPPVVAPIRNTTPRPGRNEPCWCGSGKKYKQCHLRADEG